VIRRRNTWHLRGACWPTLGPSRELIPLSLYQMGILCSTVCDLYKPSLLLLCYRTGRVTDLYQLNYEAVADVIQSGTVPEHNLI
jgi:hypothetical protein